MASRWVAKRQAAWEGGVPSSLSSRSGLLFAGLAVVLVGVGLGFLLAQTTNEAPVPVQTAPLPGATNSEIDAQPAEAVAASVVGPGIESILNAPATQQGAALAATAMATEFVYFALEPESRRQRAVDDILDPQADPLVRERFLGLLETRRAELIGPPDQERSLTAKLVSVPASYSIQEVVPGQSVQAKVWMQTVLLDPTGQRVQSSWSTVTVDLVWRDRWRVAGYARQSGPVPQLLSEGAEVSPFADVLTVFDGFNRYRYAVNP